MIILLSMVGNAIVKKNFIYNFAIGWLFTSLVLAFTAYFAPIFSREIVFIIILLSFIIFRKNQVSYIKTILLYFKSNFKILLFFYFFCYFLLLDKSIFFLKFLDNNLLHHGLAIELLTADYFGYLKFPHHYPVKLGPFHLLSNSTLAVLNLLSIQPNMHLILEAKLIVTSIFFSSFLYLINKKINNPLKVSIVSLSIFLFFYSEIKLNYDIGSNYLFFIFATITISIFHDNSLEKKEKIYLFLIFLIIQFHSKAPIGYIFIPVGMYIFIKNIEISKKFSFWLVSLISLIVVLNLYLIPKHGWIKHQAIYKIAFTSKTSLVSFVKFEPPFFEKSIEKRIINKINNHYLQSSLHTNIADLISSYAKSAGGKVDSEIVAKKLLFSFLVVLFFLIKFYLPLFYINNVSGYNIFRKEFNILLFSSILGWFFVRNSSGYHLSHQSYIYFYISLYSFIYLLYFILDKKISYKFIILFFIYGIFNFFLTGEKDFSFKSSYYQEVKLEKNLFDKNVENCLDPKFKRFIPNYTKLSYLAMSYSVKLYCLEEKQLFYYGEYFLHKFNSPPSNQ